MEEQCSQSCQSGPSSHDNGICLTSTESPSFYPHLLTLLAHPINAQSVAQVLAKEGWEGGLMRRCKLAFFAKARCPQIRLHGGVRQPELGQ